MACCKFTKKSGIIIGVFATITLLIALALLGLLASFDTLVEKKVSAVS